MSSTTFNIALLPGDGIGVDVTAEAVKVLQTLVCRAAFRIAQNRRREITLVDKANVLPSMVFFRSVFDAVAKGFPDVKPSRERAKAAIT